MPKKWYFPATCNLCGHRFTRARFSADVDHAYVSDNQCDCGGSLYLDVEDDDEDAAIADSARDRVDD